MSRVFRGCRALMAASRTASASKPASKKASPSRRGSPLMRELRLSPAMHEFLGVAEISRPVAVEKIWEYIKLHQLQNPANKREVLCDKKLKTIFDGKDTVGILEMSKLLSAHFLKPN